MQTCQIQMMNFFQHFQRSKEFLIVKQLAHQPGMQLSSDLYWFCDTIYIYYIDLIIPNKERILHLHQGFTIDLNVPNNQQVVQILHLHQGMHQSCQVFLFLLQSYCRTSSATGSAPTTSKVVRYNYSNNFQSIFMLFSYISSSLDEVVPGYEEDYQLSPSPESPAFSPITPIKSA